MPPQVRLEVTEQSHVGVARRTALRLAQELNLSETKASNVALIATELATNLARHAEGGQILLQPLRTGDDRCLEILAVDAGPGIADLSRSLSDGYSSGGTSGIGFGAVRRLSDAFDAFSSVGRGTVVMSRVYRSSNGRRPPFSFGAVSLAAPREEVCGDTWRIEEHGQRLAVLVADGLGHGPLASEAAEKAAESFVTAPFDGASDFYPRAHRHLHGTRGAALARAVVDEAGSVEYSGVGNIGGTLLGPDGSRGLASQNGTVGAGMLRPVTTLQYEWPAQGVLLMYSDGITSRWSLSAYPGLLVRHPALIAATVCRDFLRGRDDATVVVVSRHQEVRAQ